MATDQTPTQPDTDATLDRGVEAIRDLQRDGRLGRAVLTNMMCRRIVRAVLQSAGGAAPPSPDREGLVERVAEALKGAWSVTPVTAYASMNIAVRATARVVVDALAGDGQGGEPAGSWALAKRERDEARQDADQLREALQIEAEIGERLKAELERLRQERDEALADRLHAAREPFTLDKATRTVLLDGLSKLDYGFAGEIAERLRATCCPDCKGSGAAPYVGGDDDAAPCEVCDGSGMRTPLAPSTGDGEPQGLCSVRSPSIAVPGHETTVLMCELPAGHAGDHQAGETRWGLVGGSTDPGLLSLLEDPPTDLISEIARAMGKEVSFASVHSACGAIVCWLREHSQDGGGDPTWRMLGEVADEIGQAAHDLDGHPFSEGSVRQLREWEARLREIDMAASPSTGKADR